MISNYPKLLGFSESFNMSKYSHSDPVNNAMRKYENYPSLKNISETITYNINFPFLRR